MPRLLVKGSAVLADAVIENIINNTVLSLSRTTVRTDQNSEPGTHYYDE
jgi:hypothetical protein